MIAAVLLSVVAVVLALLLMAVLAAAVERATARVRVQRGPEATFDVSGVMKALTEPIDPAKFIPGFSTVQGSARDSPHMRLQSALRSETDCVLLLSEGVEPIGDPESWVSEALEQNDLVVFEGYERRTMIKEASRCGDVGAVAMRKGDGVWLAAAARALSKMSAREIEVAAANETGLLVASAVIHNKRVAYLPSPTPVERDGRHVADVFTDGRSPVLTRRLSGCESVRGEAISYPDLPVPIKLQTLC